MKIRGVCYDVGTVYGGGPGPSRRSSEDPRYDLDMSALSLVKTYAGRHGTTYPDMPWEPKEAFRAVADYYVTQAARSS
jgi:hypothetical protein